MMKTVRRILLFAVLASAIGAWLWLRWREQSYDPPYSLVEDGLFIGSFVKQPPPGTKAVVNLCGQADPHQVEAALWEPIFEGGSDPDLEWLRRVIQFIAAQRQAGRPTYVHCLAGVNRSGAVVTAYLMFEHGWGRDEALRHLQRQRPVVQPNPTLMRLLSEWEDDLRKADEELP